MKRSRYPGERLLAYRVEQTEWHELHPTDRNLACAVGRTIDRSLTRLTKADRGRLTTGELVRVRDRDALERAVIRVLRSAP